MRRIFISSNILELSEAYRDNLFKKRKPNFEKPINNDGITGNLFNLEDYLRNDCNNSRFADYVRNIISKYDEINTLNPSEYENYYDTYFNLTKEELSQKITPSNGNYKFEEKELYKLIVDAMRYDAVRDLEFLPFVKKMRIKSCIYCNAQFSITTETKNGNLSGMFELDHFFPKSKYPFLSTSFFNLHPCCSHCNKTKNDRPSSFSLYAVDYETIEPFTFSIDKKSILRYLLTHNEEELDILFNSDDLKLKENHEDLFHISELYKQHKDIVEELIWKSKIYNKSYRKSLSDSFDRFFPNSINFNRFVLGNYDNPKDIHKRPMAKMVQDIAKQLGVII